jgi:hypothetical protein
MSIAAFYEKLQIVGIFALGVTSFRQISPFDLGGLK